MSNFSTAHTFQNNSAKDVKALSGQRLVSIWWKTTEAMKKEGKKGLEPIAVSIPQITLTHNDLVMFKAHTQFLVEEAQKNIIRERAEAGKTEVTDEHISLAACLDFLNSQAEGSRVTKESVEGWFKDNLADVLTVAFADKLGVSDEPSEEETAKVSAGVESYKTTFSKLSSSKTMLPAEERNRLVKALSFVSNEDDSMVQFLMARIKAMETKQQNQLLEL